MADTTYLKHVVEDAIRDQLAAKYGVPFRSRRVQLVTGGTHEFDAVSEDGSVVVGIKSSGGKTSGGKIPVGKLKAAIAELYYLSLVQAQTRILVLTDQSFYQILARRLKGAVAPGLDLHWMQLPAGIQDKVQQVQSLASMEMSAALK